MSARGFEMNRLACMLVVIAMAPTLAWADPPSRVGRLSLVEGEASMYLDAEQGWEPARVNTPVTSENSVWTEPRSRAEVRIGSTAIRLGEATQLDVIRLDDEALQAHVARGSLSVHVRDTEKSDAYHFSTPDARFRLRGSGRYRIDADLDRGESRLTVFAGDARLEAAGGTIRVDAGRSVRISGGERASYAFEPALESPIDQWALARDERLAEREASRYVPPQMTGWEDLDDHGVWRNEPEYGAVWYPTRVEAGWAPYRYGRWTWVRPWGWAWVDDAPWGYAPFHYGRWVHFGNRWGWYPGRHVGRPIWAPALVGWVGGPGWSVSISSRPTAVVGWYPLSPYERYQPWYSTNITYVNNVNNVVIVNRRPADRRDRHYDNRERGATVVARENLFSRRPVQTIRAPVASEVVAAQPVVSGVAVLPTHSEWRGRAKPVDTAAPPQGGSAVTHRPATAPSAPTAQPGKPVMIAPSAPTSQPGKPVMIAPSAPTSQPGQPVMIAPSAPTYPAAPAPSRIGKPVPAEPYPRAKPVDPAEQQARPSAFTRPAPGDPAVRAKPVEPGAPQPRQNTFARPVPVESAPRAPTASPAEPRMKPGAVQEKPAAPQEKPGASHEKPVLEKPARGADPQSAPLEKPSRSATP
jgi:hypothetical protein